eukprot:GHRR01022366.1.p1 GENE.GHRR01022366.1~~GHRR01022366.1.p1  ORF type:complete len:373 (+),score=76.51 GHRR01022366.1:877-1995(+)
MPVLLVCCCRGSCGFFGDIPSNGFVGAWPFIETDAPGTGRGFWQEGVGGDACGKCFEVSCVPRFVESADGSIYLDRRDACRDTSLGVIIEIVDECRCSNADRQLTERGNFNWCCNVPTPRLGVDRHIDLSKQAFTQLVRGGDFGLGILGIKWRPASCDYIGPVRISSDGSTTPIGSNGGAAGGSSGGGGGGDGGPPAPAPTPAPTPAPAPGPAPISPTSESPDEPSSAPPPPPSGLDGESPGSSSSSIKLYGQCGGTGGDCSKFGGSDNCKDSLFSGYHCDGDLVCARQNVYYWQCLDSLSISNLDSNWTVTRPATQGPGCKRSFAIDQQCGGKGGDCQGDDCADKKFEGACCEGDLNCVRRNEYYWQCRLG